MNLLIEFANHEYPCRLGLINNITKILASRQSEHGWRGMVSFSNLTVGMCLGRTFPPTAYDKFRAKFAINLNLHLPVVSEDLSS
jgi:hypothetical protein